MALYANGILLPDIPSGALDTHQYGVIICITYNGQKQYILVTGDSHAIYVPKSLSGESVDLLVSMSTNVVEYEYTGTSWDGPTESKTNYIPLGTSDSYTYELVWANHDVQICVGEDENNNPILNGVYFYNSDIPVEPITPVLSDGTVLPEISAEILSAYPYVAISQCLDLGGKADGTYWFAASSAPMVYFEYGSSSGASMNIVMCPGGTSIAAKAKPGETTWSIDTDADNGAAPVGNYLGMGNFQFVWGNNIILGMFPNNNESTLFSVDIYNPFYVPSDATDRYSVPAEWAVALGFSARMFASSDSDLGRTYTFDNAINKIINESQNKQQITVTPSLEKQDVTPDDGYFALSKVTVEATPLQERTITPTSSQQVASPDESYIGFSKVTVEAYSPTLQEKTVSPTSASQDIVPDSGYDGLSKVVVSAATLQNKTITPSGAEQIITADSGYYGLGTITVAAAAQTGDIPLVEGWEF